MVKLGDEVKEIITGFSGIAVAKCEWLNGCVRVTVQPRRLDAGKVVSSETFDQEQLSVVAAGAVKIEKEQKTGGDRPNLPNRKDVVR